jgi:hypothetical protein
MGTAPRGPVVRGDACEGAEGKEQESGGEFHGENEEGLSEALTVSDREPRGNHVIGGVGYIGRLPSSASQIRLIVPRTQIVLPT